MALVSEHLKPSFVLLSIGGYVAMGSAEAALGSTKTQAIAPQPGEKVEF